MAAGIRATDALARRGSGLAGDSAATFEASGDDWGVAATSIIRAIGSAQAGDVPSVRALAAAARAHSDAIGYDAFRVPALLLEGWAAERGQDDAAAVEAYRRALEVAGRIDFGDHAAFALTSLGANALAKGDLREAEELQRQALAASEAAEAAGVAAHARVQLGHIAAASGDAAGAERFYREVLEWSQLQRPHQARESLFLALAGSPATAAQAGLEEIAAPA
jgi:tetratricopeptide (TPR) repeat protein